MDNRREGGGEMSEEEELEGFGKRRCPHCLELITPERRDNTLICPKCGKVIERKLPGGKTLRIEHPEEEEEENIVPASELTVDWSLERLPINEVKARTPFVIYNWHIRPSRFRPGTDYAIMECEDNQGRKFRWNTSGKAVIASLEEAERRGAQKILVREVLYDEVGGRPVNIRIR